MSDKITSIEFSRPFNLAKVNTNGTVLMLSANKDECEKLAARFSIPEIICLNAECQIRRMSAKERGDYHLVVNLSAEIVQRCVMTLDDVNELVEDNFSVIFMETDEGETTDAGTEIDFEFEEEDIEFISSPHIDLGEFVAEYLSLSINPYPRKTGFLKSELGYDVLDEEEDNFNPDRQNPFGILKDLKHKT